MTPEDPLQKGWARIALEADLTADESLTLGSALANLAEEPPVGSAALRRVARRLWIESRRPPAGPFGRRLVYLAALGRAQLDLFGLPFWIVSILVMLAGTAAVAAGLDPGGTLSFYLAGPLLAYAATWTAFRGQHLGTQELELSSPISARELLLVRLLLILTYDVAIGLAASGLLAILGISGIGSIVLAWLCPLILAVGTTLFAASGMPVERAGGLVYAVWAVIVVGVARMGPVSVSALPTLEAMMIAVGLALAAVVVLMLPGRFTVRARTASP